MAGAALSAGVVFAVAASATPALASTVTPPGGQDGVRAPAPDAVSVMDVPRVRPLVTRFIHASARKTYTVRSGDTLSGIAGKACGQQDKWPGVWSQNKAKVKNPDMIVPGQKLTFTCEEVTAAVVAAAMDAIPPPPAPVVQVAAQVSPAPVQQAPVQQAPVQSTAQVTGVAGGTFSGSGGMQSCIISRESGGDSQIWNASGHYGLYQFSSSTWAAHGGNPADFGHASVAEQNAIYAATVAADGYSDWAPYDGC